MICLTLINRRHNASLKCFGLRLKHCSIVCFRFDIDCMAIDRLEASWSQHQMLMIEFAGIKYCKF